jgi:hypothetical protein
MYMSLYLLAVVLTHSPTLRLLEFCFSDAIKVGRTFGSRGTQPEMRTGLRTHVSLSQTLSNRMKRSFENLGIDP